MKLKFNSKICSKSVSLFFGKVNPFRKIESMDQYLKKWILENKFALLSSWISFLRLILFKYDLKNKNILFIENESKINVFLQVWPN